MSKEQSNQTTTQAAPVSAPSSSTTEAKKKNEPSIETKSCTVTFTEKEELEKNIENLCNKTFTIRDKESSIEKYFAQNGDYIAGVVISLSVILVIGLWLGVRIFKINLIEKIQTFRGMLATLTFGTFYTCVLGITLVALYKYLGFNDDFGQGSGSLVQAIWGSAATITAAVVAILLASESIRQSKLTNKLQKEANTLALYESPAYDIFKHLEKAKRLIDQFSYRVVPILNPSHGKINDQNVVYYYNECKYFAEAVSLINESDLYMLLIHQVDFDEMKSVIDSKIIALWPHLFENEKMKTVFFIYETTKIIEGILAEVDRNKGNKERVIDILNNQGRRIWPVLYIFRAMLNTIVFEDVQHYVKEQSGTLEPAPGLEQNMEQRKHDRVKRINNYHKTMSGDNLRQLALLTTGP